MHAVSTADVGYEIAELQSVLLHVVSYRLHCVRQIKRKMLTLPCFHKRHQHVEPIALG